MLALGLCKPLFCFACCSLWGREQGEGTHSFLFCLLFPSRPLQWFFTLEAAVGSDFQFLPTLLGPASEIWTPAAWHPLHRDVSLGNTSIFFWAPEASVPARQRPLLRSKVLGSNNPNFFPLFQQPYWVVAASWNYYLWVTSEYSPLLCLFNPPKSI